MFLQIGFFCLFLCSRRYRIPGRLSLIMLSKERNKKKKDRFFALHYTLLRVVRWTLKSTQHVVDSWKSLKFSFYRVICCICSNCFVESGCNVTLWPRVRFQHRFGAGPCFFRLPNRPGSPQMDQRHWWIEIAFSSFQMGRSVLNQTCPTGHVKVSTLLLNVLFVWVPNLNINSPNSSSSKLELLQVHPELFADD